MANITQFENPIKGIDTAPLERGSEAFEREGRHIESQFNELGQRIGSGIAAVGTEYNEHEDRVQTLSAMKALSDFDVGSDQAVENAKQNMDPHDPNAIHALLDQYDQRFSDMEGKLNLTSTKAKQKLEEEHYRGRAEFGNKLVGLQSTLAGDDAVQNFTGLVDNLSNRANIDPTTVENSAARLESAIEVLPAAARKQAAKYTARLYDSGAEGIVTKLEYNPNVTGEQVDAAIKYINDPANAFDKMSPEKHAEIENRLEKLKYTQDALAGNIQALALNDVFNAIENNGADPKSVAAAEKLIGGVVGGNQKETEFKRAELTRRLDAAKAYGTAVKGVATDNLNDVVGRYNGLVDKLKDPNTDPQELGADRAAINAMSTAMVKREAEFARDPAGYTLANSQAVSSRYKAFLANPSTQSFNVYAQSMIAEQKRLGGAMSAMPEEVIKNGPDGQRIEPALNKIAVQEARGFVPSLITPDIEQRVAQALNGVTTSPEGAQGAANQLGEMAKLYGQYWPNMAHDLFRSHVLQPTQFVAAMLINKPESASVAADILRADAQPQKQLEQNFMAGAPAGTTNSKVTASIDQAFAPLRATLANAPGGGELIDGYEAAVRNVLFVRGSKNISQDATRLAGKMIMDEYDFPRGTTLRVPKSAGVDASKVSYGARSIQNIIGEHDIVVPASISLGPMDTAKNYAADVKAYGHWETSPDEQGAILFDGQNHAVFEHRMGKVVPVQLKWKDLNQVGETQLNDVDKVWRFLSGQEL